MLGKGWVAAGDIVAGDEVYNLDGTTAVVIGSWLEKLDAPILVYNLEVEDFHSYFVGYEPILVHNRYDSTNRQINPSKQESPIYNSFKRVKGLDRRTSGSGSNKKFYEWDYTHNDIEVYNNKGNHLGSMDPMTGEMYKPAVSGRKIDV